KWLAKLNTNTPAITATAMLIASTAGVRSIFFQVRFEGGARAFFENHSADLAGMGIRRTKRATGRSKFCLWKNSAEPARREIGRAVRARYRRAHRTVGQLTRADRCAIRKRALAAHRRQQFHTSVG